MSDTQGTRDARIDRWLGKDRPWRDELALLRDILLSEPLTETLRWRQPCYQAHDANIAILAAMKDSVAVSFLKGALLDDPDGRLERPGPNSRSARYMRFTDASGIETDADRLRAFVRQAIEAERQGLKVDLPPDDLDLPEELTQALDADEELAAAWAALTPGRRRGWVVHVSGAKQPATRESRIDKARDRILAGQGMHDR